MSFAENAKFLRLEKGYSQKALGEALGISPAAIGHLELGKHEPGSTTLIAYAKFFGESVDALLDLDSIPLSKKVIQNSAEENELLNLYRILPTEFKQSLLNTARIWAGSSASIASKKKV